ncbi:MAG: CPBP family intramembrane metalloprotease [Nibricoccus sp.]
MSDKLIVAGAIEGVLVLTGLALLWCLALSPSARARARQPMPLPFWQVPAYSYALAAVLMLGTGAMFRPFISSLMRECAPGLSQTQGLGVIINELASHVGLILGMGAGWYLLKSSRFVAALAAANSAENTPRRLDWKYVPLAGAAVAAILIVCKGPLSSVFMIILQALGIPVNVQDSVALFATAKTPLETTLLVTLACAIAPISEELVFRAGLFRYVRGRIPRWAALTGPALLFTALHFSIVSTPSLFLFGVIQAVAYERTGRIAVPIIAHALFNLHTTISLLLGLDPYAALGNWLKL